MAFKFPDRGIQPDGFAKIEHIAQFIQAVKNLLLNRLICVNTINPTSKIEKFIVALMKAAIKVSVLLIVSLPIIEFIQEICRSNVTFAVKNFSIKLIGNIILIIFIKILLKIN